MTGRGPARRAGFTLIEVIGALLIFSVGVIMVLQITTALSRRMEWAALESLITAEAQERLDSLSAAGYASNTNVAATLNDTVTLAPSPYTPTLTFAPAPLMGCRSSDNPVGSSPPTFDSPQRRTYLPSIK
mgnify:CR=1 FL=1